MYWWIYGVMLETASELSAEKYEKLVAQDEDGWKTEQHLMAVNKAVKYWQNCMGFLKNSC